MTQPKAAFSDTENAQKLCQFLGCAGVSGSTVAFEVTQ
jgi:hypothetical protein